MDNAHLFELLSAGPGLSAVALLLAAVLAKWVVLAVPVALGFSWLRVERAARAELAEMAAAALLALGLAQLAGWLWPQPGLLALHPGAPALAHAAGAGLPSVHVLLLWSLALSALLNRRLAAWGFPLLAAGLAVGWGRVFLGLNFPYDVVAALPLAGLGALGAHALRARVSRWVDRLLDYDRRRRSTNRGGWRGRHRR